MLYRWFQWLFFGDKPQQVGSAAAFGRSSDPDYTHSKGRSAACDRLKLVLMHDRTALEPEALDRLRVEMVELISRYVPIDQTAIELNLEKDPATNTVALVANIPVKPRAAAVKPNTEETSAATTTTTAAVLNAAADSSSSVSSSDTVEPTKTEAVHLASH